MPVLTRKGSYRENNSDTKTTPKIKMSDKKKEMTLDDLFGEIQKGNKKTEVSIAGLGKKN